jgi:hypothetical protein
MLYTGCIKKGNATLACYHELYIKFNYLFFLRWELHVKLLSEYRIFLIWDLNLSRLDQDGATHVQASSFGKYLAILHRNSLSD